MYFSSPTKKWVSLKQMNIKMLIYFRKIFGSYVAMTGIVPYRGPRPALCIGLRFAKFARCMFFCASAGGAPAHESR